MEGLQLGYDPVRLFTFDKYCTCNEDCECGEKDEHEWTWNEELASESLQFSKHNLEVNFHPTYSNGTAAVRGSKPMAKGRHHYWEVKMITSIYGTDVMVGIGTRKADLNKGKFCSLLGEDKESWGFSYKGYLQYGGEVRNYGPYFGQGSLVGVHLDTWKGTLEFYLNRKPLGIAFIGLKRGDLYPMISSTAARSKVRITHSCSLPTSLQLESLAVLKPIQKAYLASVFPGLRQLLQSTLAEVLQRDNDESEDEFPEDKFSIFDDFDVALVRWSKKRKRINDNEGAATKARCACEVCGTLITAMSAHPLCDLCKE